MPNFGPFPDSVNSYVPAQPLNMVSLDYATTLFGNPTISCGASRSVLIPDAGDRLSLPGDFTLDIWARPTTNSFKQGIVCTFSGANGAVGSFALSRYFDHTIQVAGSGGLSIFSASATVASGIWRHVALTRAAGVLKVWLDGEPGGSASYPATLQLGQWYLGVESSGGPSGNFFDGNFAEFRLTKDVVRYTAPFTRPTGPFAENSTDDPHWANVVSLVHGSSYVVPSGFKTLPAVAGTQPFTPSWPVTPRALPGVARSRDMYYGGNGTVYGTVKRKDTPTNAPLARRVRLYRTREMKAIGETWSDPVTGNYAFTDIAQGVDYTVISNDYQQLFRAVGADIISL